MWVTLPTKKNAIGIMFALVMVFGADSHAIDFLGAQISDSDTPSSLMRVGLFGYRPVVSDNAAEPEAGGSILRRGDIILAVNGREVKKSAELGQLASEAQSVTVFRGNEKKTLTVSRKQQAVPAATQSAPASPENAAATVEQRSSVAISSAPDVQQATPAQTDSLVKIAPVTVQPETSQPVAVDSVEKDPKKPCVTGDPTCPSALKPPVQQGEQPAKSDIFTRSFKRAQDKIVFENNKGKVVFSHSVHLRSLNKVQCLLCHQTENPTPESIQSRLDNHRAAHGFCRGCHQSSGKGPTTECYACHDYSKKN